MKQIYSVTTYYQLITSIQIKKTIYPNTVADIVIDDSSAEYLKIAENLKKQNIFKNVFIAVTHKKKRADIFEKAVTTINTVLNNNSYAKRCSNINEYNYDQFLFFNYNYFNSCLYYKMKNSNPKLIHCRFEEGYVCYFNFNIFLCRSIRLKLMLGTKYNKANMYDIDEMFFYEPDLVLIKDKYKKITSIPKIDRKDTETVSILNSVFNYKKTADEYDRKYIFFEQPFLQDGIDIDDLDLVLKIADKVGKENLMVKLHPRSKTDRFSKYGIKTNKVVSTPWEIIIMNNEFSDNVFLTISSGSVLSPRIIFGDTPPVYMLFNCTQKKERKVVTNDFLKFMADFKSKFNDGKFFIPENCNDFFEMLQ